MKHHIFQDNTHIGQEVQIDDWNVEEELQIQMVQKEQRVQSHYLLEQMKAVARPLHLTDRFRRSFQTVADQKLEDKKWRMWVVQVVWVKKHNNIISILQEDNVSGNS